MAQANPPVKDNDAQISTCETLIPATKKLFDNPVYSDFTIICGAREWKVHKSVVCTQSAYFAKAADGLFKEAGDHAITLHEDDEDAVNAMIEFFYTQDYTPPVDKTLPFHTLVYHLAGKYMLATTLQELAARKFSANAEESWNTTAFTEAISKVFELADVEGDALTAAVIRISKERITLLMATQSEFKKVLTEVPSLAAALLEDTLQKLDATSKERDVAKKKPDRAGTGARYIKCPNAECQFLAGTPSNYTFILSSRMNPGLPVSCPTCGTSKTVAQWEPVQ